MKRWLSLILTLLICNPLIATTAVAASSDEQAELDFDSLEFEDRPLQQALHLPDWFKLSFLDLRDDLDSAVREGKDGIIVYFGQKHCAYCKALLKVNWGKPDIVKYTQKHFDVIAIDIWGDREVTDMNDRTLTEKIYAEQQKTNFTPSLVFYARNGSEALTLRGYYPPYRFRAALEFVADRHYQSMNFAQFLAIAPTTLAFEQDELIEESFFESPPYALDRSRFPGSQPLLVIFEQGDCYACDVLHTGPLQDPDIREQLKQFQTVQLNFNGDDPVITPGGEHTTERKWAKQLDLFYTPSLLFFDEHGREIIRVDSVVRFSRLANVLDYVLDKGYQRYPTFQRWRQSHSANTGGSGTPVSSH